MICARVSATEVSGALLWNDLLIRQAHEAETVPGYRTGLW